MANQPVFFYHEESKQVKKCIIVSRKRRTCKIQVLNDTKTGKDVEVIKVNRDLIGLTLEEANARYIEFQEKQRRKEAERQEAYRLNFESYTMAYFRQNNQEVLLQIMESKPKTFIVFDEFGEKRVKLKTSFLRLAETNELLVLPDPDNIQPGNIVSFYYMKQKIEGKVVKVHTESVIAEVEEIGQQFNVPKRHCRKLYRNKEDWLYDDMAFTVTFSRSIREAERIKEWLSQERIPSVIKYDFSGVYNICTLEKHYVQAMNLLQDSCEVKNLFTGQTVQKAKWAKKFA